MAKIIDFQQHREMKLIRENRDKEYHRYMEMLFGYDWINEEFDKEDE